MMGGSMSRCCCAVAAAVISAVCARPSAAAQARGILDTLRLGDEASERAHAFASENSIVRKGGLDQQCRVIMPAAPPSVTGGAVEFTVRCDPQGQTYLTARLWGGDVGETALYIHHDGRQLGSNQSDWPALDKLNWREKEPRFPGRFFYSTYMLPPKITRGRERVTLRIVSKGRVYSYASSYEKAQYKQNVPSQEIHAVYTHTASFFTPPAGEVQGTPPRPGPVWRPDSELKPVEHAIREAQKMLDGALRRELLRPNEALGLAIAYGSPWARQHGDPAALERVIATVDAYVTKDDVKSLGWFGPGELAEAVWRVFDDAGKAGCFTEAVGTGDRARGRAYAEFFRRCIDHQTEPRNRGGLTNQDIYIVTSVYRSHMLLEKLDPARALPKAKALEYVHQAIGLKPYRGRRYPGKGVQMSTAYRFIIGGPVFLSEDRDYFWVTPKGSSKEHGYVPHYGELAHQTATLYELTRDETVKRQAVRMIAARAPFRVMSNDRDGNACLRIEAAIGWRHSWYGGAVLYADHAERVPTAHARRPAGLRVGRRRHLRGRLQARGAARLDGARLAGRGHQQHSTRPLHGAGRRPHSEHPHRYRVHTERHDDHAPEGAERLLRRVRREARHRR